MANLPNVCNVRGLLLQTIIFYKDDLTDNKERENVQQGQGQTAW